jgi:hypothetical protein
MDTSRDSDEYMVSLDIWSDDFALEELAHRLGSAPGDHSHSKGDPHRKGSWPRTVWRLQSPLPDDAPLADQLAALKEIAGSMGLFAAGRLPLNAQAVLNIGVLYAGPCCELSLGQAEIRAFIEAGCSLEISAYPS